MVALVINPTRSAALETSLRECLAGKTSIQLDFFTCQSPECPAEIYNFSQEVESAYHCYRELVSVHEKYSGFLVCCYSDHPLVYMLRELVGHRPVMGIFQASVLQCIAMDLRFAIVTTTASWEPLLDKAVELFRGAKFAGTYSTGLGVLEAHEGGNSILDKCNEVVKDPKLEAICLGCAGMVGLTEEVRAGLNRDVVLVDGVLSGATLLESLIKSL